MQTPIPPSLTDFGLTEDSLARLPKKRFDQNKWEKRSVFSSFSVLALVIILAYHVSALIAPALLLFVIAPSGLITYSILIWGEKKLLCLRNEDFKNACAYWAACDDYSRKKAEFDAWIRKQKEEYWRSLSGIGFENELGKLFSLMGYNVNFTPRTGDGGVDLFLRKDGKLTVVQCKAHNKRIPIGVARELSASMKDFQADNAIIACFEGVTQPVSEYIKNKPITVLKLGDIVELQRQHG